MVTVDQEQERPKQKRTKREQVVVRRTVNRSCVLPITILSIFFVASLDRETKQFEHLLEHLLFSSPRIKTGPIVHHLCRGRYRTNRWSLKKSLLAFNISFCAAGLQKIQGSVDHENQSRCHGLGKEWFM